VLFTSCKMVYSIYLYNLGYIGYTALYRFCQSSFTGINREITVLMLQI